MPGINNGIKGNIICIKTIDNEVTIEDLEKCTQSPVQNVERKPKYLSNLMEPDQYIVGIVIRSIGQKDIRKKIPFIEDHIFSNIFFLFFKVI